MCTCFFWQYLRANSRTCTARVLQIFCDLLGASVCAQMNTTSISTLWHRRCLNHHRFLARLLHRRRHLLRARHILPFGGGSRAQAGAIGLRATAHDLVGVVVVRKVTESETNWSDFMPGSFLRLMSVLCPSLPAAFDLHPAVAKLSLRCALYCCFRVLSSQDAMLPPFRLF